MPKMALNRFVKYLVITYRGLQECVPVDKPFAAVDEALREEIEKRLTHSTRANLIERKSRSVPIAAAPHLFQLRDNPRFILIFP